MLLCQFYSPYRPDRASFLAIPEDRSASPGRSKFESNSRQNRSVPSRKHLMPGKGPLSPGCGLHIPGIWFGPPISPGPLNRRGSISGTPLMNGLLNLLQNRQKNKCKITKKSLRLFKIDQILNYNFTNEICYIRPINKGLISICYATNTDNHMGYSN